MLVPPLTGQQTLEPLCSQPILQNQTQSGTLEYTLQNGNLFYLSILAHHPYEDAAGSWIPHKTTRDTQKIFLRIRKLFKQQ